MARCWLGLGLLWLLSFGGLAQQPAHGVGVWVPLVLMVQVPELGLVARYEGQVLELVLPAGVYTLRVVANTRWVLRLEGVEGLPPEVWGKGRAILPLEVPPGGQARLRLAPGE